MSSYDFILDNIRFSYSAISTYNTCPYAYKLNYIDSMPRINNFFAEYGLLVHECFEKFFGGEMEPYELSGYYEEEFNKRVVTAPPIFLSNLDYKYRVQGKAFFDSFSFDKSAYDILILEDKIDFKVKGIKLVAKPDLVLKEIETGKIIQYDYKTSTPFRIDKYTGKEIADNSKLKGYYKQMFIYAYALRHKMKMPLEKTILLFTRLKKEVELPCSIEKEDEAIAWMIEGVKKIRADEEFLFDNSSSFFCNNLCGVRESCEFKG